MVLFTNTFKIIVRQWCVTVFFFSYSDNSSKTDTIVKKLVTGDEAPVNKVYMPEFVTLAPPLMNCQDEVSRKSK